MLEKDYALASLIFVFNKLIGECDCKLNGNIRRNFEGVNSEIDNLDLGTSM